jgi:hypothetical protein
MSDDAEKSPPQNDPPQSSTERPQDQPTSSADTGSVAAPRGLRGSGLKYPDAPDVPSWARGKTADEVLELGSTFYNAALAAPPAPNVAPPPSQTPAPKTMSDQNAGPQQPDPQLMYSNPAMYQQQLLDYNNAVLASQMQAYAAPMLSQQATLARDAARRDSKYNAIWAKYEAEIDAQMANVPLQARTVDAWNMAANIVAGDHLDEIAQERAQALAARVDTGSLSGGEVQPLNGTPAGDPISELFRTDDPAIAKFKAQGMDARKVLAHAASQGHTPERYAEMLKKGSIVRSVTYETRNGETTAVPTAS